MYPCIFRYMYHKRITMLVTNVLREVVSQILFILIFCNQLVFILFLFIHDFNRSAHLATLDSLPCGRLDIFTYILIHTI